MIVRTIWVGLFALATTSSALGQDAARSAVAPNAEGTIPAFDSALPPCPTATAALDSAAPPVAPKPGGKVAMQDMTVMKTVPTPTTKEPTGKASLQDFHRTAAPGQDPAESTAACAAPVAAKP
jgi:hypothetical protein